MEHVLEFRGEPEGERHPVRGGRVASVARWSGGSYRISQQSHGKYKFDVFSQVDGMAKEYLGSCKTREGAIALARKFHLKANRGS